jgi:hypothetical protein
MEYKRLTTENPQGNTGHMLNMTKVISKEVYLRDIDGESDISLVEYCKGIYKKEYGTDLDADAEEFGEYMDDDSLLSLFYWIAVGHAELRLRLAAYEDSGLSPEQVQEISEKATLKKVIPNKRIKGLGKCPICKTELYTDDKDLHFCPTCGQALETGSDTP